TSAMTEILTAHPQLRFQALGTGLQESSVREGFPVSLHSRIFVAARIEPASLAWSLARTAIFVFPTLYEGYGMVLAEAMASGCAVVTTPTGAGAELVRHEHNGLLVEPGDSAALVSSIESLLRSPKNGECLAGEAVRTAQRLGWSTTARQLEA